jgi:citrate synthase
MCSIKVTLSGTKDDDLLNLLATAHANAANHNENASTQFATIATKGSGDFSKGVIAALATVGGQHAPLREARNLWDNYAADHPNPVPGFGNTFYKDKIDPQFTPVVKYIKDVYPDYYKRLVELTNYVAEFVGKRLQPNAAMFTAMVCDICGIPEGMEYLIFLLARAPVWADKSFNNNKGGE